MPLLDHFRGALSDKRHWESFHGAWAYEMMGHLNQQILPKDYFAEAQVSLGTEVEIDLATFEESSETVPGAGNGAGGVALQTWAPPATALVMPALFPDDIEVRIFRAQGGAMLVGAVELVSPGNKDRPEARRAFVAKCASYLHRGIGLVILDVVTTRQANMHDELIQFLGHAEAFAFPVESLLYTTAYRPRRREKTDQIEVWPFALAIGQALPIVPLALRGGPTFPLNLESTYTEARNRSRI
jgi:Protein of unknown function (DUF4058)